MKGGVCGRRYSPTRPDSTASQPMACRYSGPVAEWNADRVARRRRRLHPFRVRRFDQAGVQRGLESAGIGWLAPLTDLGTVKGVTSVSWATGSVVTRVYLLVYRTERTEQNGHSLGWLDQAHSALAGRHKPLSHPGGRRFEPG